MNRREFLEVAGLVGLLSILSSCKTRKSKEQLLEEYKKKYSKRVDLVGIIDYTGIPYQGVAIEGEQYILRNIETTIDEVKREEPNNPVALIDIDKQTGFLSRTYEGEFLNPKLEGKKVRIKGTYFSDINPYFEIWYGFTIAGYPERAIVIDKLEIVQ